MLSRISWPRWALVVAMLSGRRLFLLALCCLPSLVAPATASAGSVQLDRASVIANVDAYRGVVAWTSTTAGVSRLYVRRGGHTHRVKGVASTSTGVESLDVGPDGHGGARVVFSGCPGQCGLFTVTGDRPRKLAVSSDRFSELAPSVWGSRIAFLRISGGSGPAEIRVGRTGEAATSPGPHGPIADSSEPISVALNGDQVAFTSLGSLGSCTAADSPDGQDQELYVAASNSPARQLAAACESNPVTSLRLLGWRGANIVLQTSTSGSRQQLRLLTAGGTLVATAPLPSGVGAIAQDSRTSYYTVSDRSKTRLLQAHDLVAFR